MKLGFKRNRFVAMDLRGRRANIHLQFSKITVSKNISILLQLRRRIKNKKEKKMLPVGPKRSTDGHKC